MENSEKLKTFQVSLKLVFPKAFSNHEEQLIMVNEFSSKLCNVFTPDLCCVKMESRLSKDDQHGYSANYTIDIKELHDDSGMNLDEFQVDFSHLWKSIIFERKDFVIVTDVKIIS